MFSRPAQDNDFLAKLLACCRGEPSTEEIDSDDFVAQRKSDASRINVLVLELEALAFE